MEQGLLVVICGPSGVGKGTVLKRVMERIDIELSISVTTRNPRDGERDGIDYRFVSEDTFENMIKEDMLLEYANVFGLAYYGTPKDKVVSVINSGRDIVLEIDVRGAIQIMDKYPECLTIFIMPPSMKILEQRLRSRGTETEEKILRRLAEAKKELAEYTRFDYVVFNDDLDKAVDRVVSIIDADKSKIVRNKIKIQELLMQ